jgi:tetratricopeptide (TPR) repeat protein
MILATLLLAGALAPQEPPMAPPEPPPEPAAAPAVPTASAELQSRLDAGLAAFKRRRFAAARAEFEKAAAADPTSAAAAFYLGYAHYKIAEPTRRLTPDKERAKELFAKAFTLDPGFKPAWGGAPKR